MQILLIILSIVVFVFGMLFATGAPQEAVVAGAACFIGILARIAQASEHHKAIMQQQRTNQVAQSVIS